MGIKKLNNNEESSHIRGKFISGCFTEWSENALNFAGKLIEEHGPNPSFEMFMHPLCLLTEVEDISKVLKEDVECFGKGPTANGLMPLIGKGLLLSQEGLWRRQRQLSQPAFHKKKISGFISPIIKLSDEVLNEWEKKAEIDIFHEVSQLTFKGISRTVLGSNIDDYAENASRELSSALQVFADRCANIRSLPLWIPTPTNQKVNQSLKNLDAIVFQVIADRRKLKDKPQDLLTELITAKDEKGQMSDQQLRDELMTLLLAGFDTTSNLITWTIYLLASHPEWENKLYEEVKRVSLDDSTKISSLSKLEVLFSIIKEALRLYPPAWIYARTPLKSYVLKDRIFGKNSTLLISPYYLHRDKRFWTNPEDFDPSRMAKINHIADLEKGYMPFSNGERICIGANFAITEAMTILCKIYQRFQFSGNDTTKVYPRAAITLKPSRALNWKPIKR